MSQKLDTHESSSKLLNAGKIAFVVSIILHLLVYKYGFPQLIIRDNKVSLEGTVATIELNPFEAARLPNLEPRWEIPDFNTSPLDGTAPPFAFPSSITPTPGIFPNLLPVPIPLPPNFDLLSLPSISTNIELPPIGDFSALPLPPALGDLDSIKPPAEKLPEPASETKTKPNPASETKTEPKPTPKQIAAVRQQKLQGEIRDISASLKKQKIGTTDEEARKNYLTWLTKVKTTEPEGIEIEGIYPRDACIQRLEGTSVYGVIVDSNNAVVALELIKSANYPIFNQQASKDITNRYFDNNTGQPKPYRVNVNYKYNAEICPSLTLPSLRKKTQTPQPPKTPEAKPAPAPTPEAKPAPAPTPEAKPTPAATPEAKPAPAPTSEAKPTPVPTPEAKPAPAATSGAKTPPLPSLRERLQNTPLLDDDSIRERLRNSPLSEKE